MAGRTITITHRGTTALVIEDREGRCVIKVGDHRQKTDNRFPEAAEEALAWIMEDRNERDGI